MNKTKEQFLSELCDQFKAFVIDQAPGYLEYYDDHLEFLEDTMKEFIDRKNDEAE